MLGPNATSRPASPDNFGDHAMSFNKGKRPYSAPKGKRVLIGETREEEAARLAKEIAAHPVTKCEPGVHTPSSSRPGWSNKPFIPQAERTVAEGIAKKMLRKPR
jgi:hypothetical protein